MLFYFVQFLLVNFDTLCHQKKIRAKLKTNIHVFCLEIEVDDQPETRDGTRRPFFVVEPQNKWVEVGGRATLEAQASGRPVPTFSW